MDEKIKMLIFFTSHVIKSDNNCVKPIHGEIIISNDIMKAAKPKIRHHVGFTLLKTHFPWIFIFSWSSYQKNYSND